MTMMAKKLWIELRNQIASFDSLTRLELVQLIAKTIQKNKSKITQDMLEKYPIFHFIARNDITDYIVENAPRNDDFNSVKRIFMEIEPSSDASSISLIAEMVRGLVEYKTNINCPSCNDDELVAMFDVNRGKVLLVCNICGWVQDINGIENNTIIGKLSPVKKDILKQSSLLE